MSDQIANAVAAMQERASQTDGYGTGPDDGGAAYAPPPLEQLTGAGGRSAPNFMLDVRINLTVEVGRVQLPLRQVMELGPGSLIELGRSATDPVEIYANGRCIGRGEIVVVGEQFGIRIVELGATA